MIFEKLPAVRLLPRYVSVVVNVFCAAVARSFSIFDIDYGVDDGDLSISPPPPPSSSERRGFLTAMVVVLCARFAPSPLDDVSHRKGCPRLSFGRKSPRPLLSKG